ncbi:hypothetical protein [Brumimicrobium oceani]|uniref:Uncharacterized protein n=1 Tax=Brumimicrobium oceani TaxID=2100725 RepID=A0A2U2X384_9FLAO|nr:hypothetical protein [Brumimicrobium oceani]PWH82242.1 hypothetical protein DIT68_14150 [Brumimicrobium oceani]
MKKGHALSFTATLFLTFGITDLDFSNPVFEDNFAAYILLIIGSILMVFNVIYWRKLNKGK